MTVGANMGLHYVYKWVFDMYQQLIVMALTWNMVVIIEAF